MTRRTVLKSIRTVLVCAALPVWPAVAAEFPPPVTAKDVPRLIEATAFVRSLDEAALRRLVPMQSGLRYVGCPNCNAGRQENQLEWSTERPGEVYCRFCSHRYPSSKYPMNAAVEVRNPRGETQRYPYWADASGYRYFFAARRDDLVRVHLANAARDLALLYVATGDRSYAARAAVLLDQFARVFPGWSYHYDFPFRQKEIYDGDVPPAKFRPNYRTSRWHWWAYRDVPIVLVEAYDWIRASGALDSAAGARIEKDLLRNAGDQVLNNVDDYTNMSPSAWTSLITLGRVIGEPRYVHEPVRRFRHFMDTQFFYDYSWHEGSPSYHKQTTGLLTGVLDALRGYSDPAGYVDAGDRTRFDKLDLAASFPALARSTAVLNRMRLPDGRAVPVHDTWSTDQEAAPAASASWLLPALGHACLGSGRGEAQWQYHLTWSGGYGHQHADNLSLLLFAHGREKLSDIGYSHTRYRPWTLASAAHNLVVIDGVNQHAGNLSNPSDGALRFFDTSEAGVKVVSASGERGYPNRARVYRRTLVVVDGTYAVDIFEVEGGSTHDYFLHGDADRPAEVSAPLNFKPLATLLPAGLEWKPTRYESDTARLSQPWYAYGFLNELREAAAPAGTPLPVTFPGLRVTLLPEANSRLLLGRNPSIRQAGEDDAKLSAFSRPFLMLRHAASRSVFAAVLEPFDAASAEASIERLSLAGATAAVRVHVGGRTDLVIYGAPSAVSVPAGSGTAKFTGELGVLSLEGDKMVRAYVLGQGGWTRGSFSVAASTGHAALAGVGAGKLQVSAVNGSLPKPGNIVRVVTADGWVYPFTVTAAKPAGEGTAVITVSEGSGLALGAGTLQLTAYPRRTHTGGAQVEWHLAGRSGKR